ncbi:hypothetical protein B0H13DRAFT_2392310 [Mycena leptocephala]|nr:hypothetical protein B0H13DRAFT_2392310 [Mycena leptocephala]
MPSAIRIHMLRAFIEFLAEHRSPLSRYDASWRWIASEKGLAAHKWATPDPTPIRFTVFGFVTHAPEWGLNGSMGQDLCIRFDMQLLTLIRVLEHQGQTFDLKNKIVISGDDAGPSNLCCSPPSL